MINNSQYRKTVDLSKLNLTFMQSMISLGPVEVGSNLNFPLSVAKATTADFTPFILPT